MFVVIQLSAIDCFAYKRLKMALHLSDIHEYLFRKLVLFAKIVNKRTDVA